MCSDAEMKNTWTQPIVMDIANAMSVPSTESAVTSADINLVFD